jgi:hypothetical protein
MDIANMSSQELQFVLEEKLREDFGRPISLKLGDKSNDVENLRMTYPTLYITIRELIFNIPEAHDKNAEIFITLNDGILHFRIVGGIDPIKTEYLALWSSKKRLNNEKTTGRRGEARWSLFVWGTPFVVYKQNGKKWELTWKNSTNVIEDSEPTYMDKRTEVTFDIPMFSLPEGFEVKELEKELLKTFSPALKYLNTKITITYNGKTTDLDVNKILPQATQPFIDEPIEYEGEKFRTIIWKLESEKTEFPTYKYMPIGGLRAVDQLGCVIHLNQLGTTHHNVGGCFGFIISIDNDFWSRRVDPTKRAVEQDTKAQDLIRICVKKYKDALDLLVPPIEAEDEVNDVLEDLEDAETIEARCPKCRSVDYKKTIKTIRNKAQLEKYLDDTDLLKSPEKEDALEKYNTKEHRGITILICQNPKCKHTWYHFKDIDTDDPKKWHYKLQEFEPKEQDPTTGFIFEYDIDKEKRVLTIGVNIKEKTFDPDSHLLPNCPQLAQDWNDWIADKHRSNKELRSLFEFLLQRAFFITKNLNLYENNSDSFRKEWKSLDKILDDYRRGGRSLLSLIKRFPQVP